MEGIKYVTDEREQRRYVQIDLDKFGEEYIEDLLDGLRAESRKGEEVIPLEQALAELRAAGKLDE